MLARKKIRPCIGDAAIHPMTLMNNRLHFQLKQLAAATLMASLGGSALAANYFFVTPKLASMTQVAPFNVTLGSATLPLGVVGVAYNAGTGFDFAPLATITGDPALTPALVTFSASAGSLPAGLTTVA